jgi:hypothetical protein
VSPTVLEALKKEEERAACQRREGMGCGGGNGVRGIEPDAGGGERFLNDGRVMYKRA